MGEGERGEGMGRGVGGEGSGEMGDAVHFG